MNKTFLMLGLLFASLIVNPVLQAEEQTDMKQMPKQTEVRPAPAPVDDSVKGACR